MKKYMQMFNVQLVKSEIDSAILPNYHYYISTKLCTPSYTKG